MNIRSYARAALAVSAIAVLGAAGSVLADPTPDPLLCVTDLDGQKRCYLEEEFCELGLDECDGEQGELSRREQVGADLGGTP